MVKRSRLVATEPAPCGYVGKEPNAAQQRPLLADTLVGEQTEIAAPWPTARQQLLVADSPMPLSNRQVGHWFRTSPVACGHPAPHESCT